MTSTLDSNPLLAAAQIAGFTAPVFMAGYQVGLSQLAIPPLLTQTQQISTPIFAHVFRAGATVAVPLSVLGFLGSALAAYSAPTVPLFPNTALVSQRTLWTVAAGLCLAVPIYTKFVMVEGIINPLLERADGFAAGTRTAAMVEKGDEEKVKVWLRAWARCNYIRSGIFGSAAALAAYAIITQP